MLPHREETINQVLSQGRAYNYASVSGDPRYYILGELPWGKDSWGKLGAGIPTMTPGSRELIGILMDPDTRYWQLQGSWGQP